MKNKIIKKWLGMFVYVFSFFVFNNVQAQVWQETLENQFDIVETFDGLNDWAGTSTSAGYFVNTNLPVKTSDSSASIWDMYYYQSSVDSTYTWIDDHGIDNIWQGFGKSLRLDLSQQGAIDHKGPSRFGLYFTNGNGYATSGQPSDGYSDLHIFYMVKMPYNHFPYRDENGDFNGYWSYYKFNTLSAGFYSANVPYDEYAAIDGQGQVYGQSHFLPDIKTGSSYDYELFMKPGLRLDTTSDADWNNYLLYEAYDAVLAGAVGSSMKSYLGTGIGMEKWFGVEFRLKMGDAGVANGIGEMWLYDSFGTATKVWEKTDCLMVEAGENYKYNFFFFGGNHSFLPQEISEALDMAYYVDDFIIDDQRIGPTYFSLLNDQSIPETCTDSIQNQDETGIDCGGVCEACVVPITYNLTNFISAITNWLQIGNETSDVNSDGIVNTRDLGVMMSNWGN